MKKHIIRNTLLVCAVMMASYACSSPQKTETAVTKKASTTTKSTTNKTEPVTKTKAKKKASKTVAKKKNSNPNRFNRILAKRNASSDAVQYDPNNPSLGYLQKPADAFKGLPKARTGNKIDWVKAIDSGKIKPRHDILDPTVEPMVMDLNIVMQVKGSMPDVVFPHKKHTRWLDCSNCHPAIFIPQAGANKMSMADNLLGKRCGVCHGKVAFPLSSCTKCHSNKKVVVKKKKIMY